MQIFEPYELTGLKPNHLGFGGLDRGAELHEDKDCIQNLLGAEEKGYRTLTNIGADGGQEVPHLHFHIFAGEKIGQMVF